ncbi:MAG: ribosome silencing factor, partial [Clostridiales bacterium]|nr:ribosome silencing factor [Clostridiales bacterium]
MTSQELKNNICRILDSKKAADITILDVERLTVLADYFIIAGGTSTTNVKALAEYVEEKMEEKGVFAIRKEGLKDARWVVYDYGSVILHILLDDMRLFYCLEKLWSDGKNLEKYMSEQENGIEKPLKTVKKEVKTAKEKQENEIEKPLKTAKKEVKTVKLKQEDGIEKPLKTVKKEVKAAKEKQENVLEKPLKTVKKEVKAAKEKQENGIEMPL